MDFSQIVELGWKIFVVLHLLNFHFGADGKIINRSGIPVAIFNLLAAGFIAYLNVHFGLSPWKLSSLGIHLGVNLVPALLTNMGRDWQSSKKTAALVDKLLQGQTADVLAAIQAEREIFWRRGH